MYAKFMAMDQYGNTHFLDAHPRKELLALTGYKHADKMYRGMDTPKHVGYVIGGHWWEVFKILPMKD